MITLDQDLILMDLQAENKETVIRAVVDQMVEKGYVEPSYYDEVIKREKDYPTGLPSEGVMTAVPHAFCSTVKKTGIGVAVLRTPVLFQNASDYSEELPVSLVFVMANAQGEEEHLSGLQDLMGVFCKKQMLLDLYASKTPEQFIEIMESGDRYQED